MVFAMDPLLSALISKQILSQVETDISNGNTSSLYIQDDFEFRNFSTELFNKKMTIETEFVDFDEYGEERILNDTSKYDVKDLNVFLNFLLAMIWIKMNCTPN